MITRKHYISQCEKVFRDFTGDLSRYGVYVSKELKIVYEDCFFCYYDLQKKVISFSVPDIGTLEGKLQWYYFMNILGTDSLEDVQRFGELIIPRTVSHEVAHHLRDYYGTTSGNNWIEEHVANAVAASYTKGAYEKDKEFLRRFLARAIERLAGLMENKRDISASYFDLGQILLAENKINRRHLDEAVSYSRKTGMTLNEVLVARKLVSREELGRYLYKQKKESGYFNSRYMVNSIEYGYFHWTWFLAELEDTQHKDFGEILNTYILNEDYDSLRKEESILVCLDAIRSGKRQQSEAAARILADELDAKTSGELLGDLDTFPQHAQPVLFSRIKELLPGEQCIRYCRAVLARFRSGKAFEAAMEYLYRYDREAVTKIVEQQLNSGDTRETISAINVVGMLKLSGYKEYVERSLSSGDAGVKKAAWDALLLFDNLAPGKRKELIESGLSESHPGIRAIALGLYDPGDISELDRFLQDEEVVKRVAVSKLKAFMSDPFEVLRRVDYSYDIFGELLYESINEKGMLDRGLMEQLTKWCLEMVQRLRYLKGSVVHDNPFAAIYSNIIGEAIYGWIKVALISWSYVNGNEEILRLYGFLSYYDTEPRKYTLEIIRAGVPAGLFNSLFVEKPSGPASLVELYRSSGIVMKALVVLGVARSVFTLDHRNREELLEYAVSDQSFLVKEVVSDYHVL